MIKCKLHLWARLRFHSPASARHDVIDADGDSLVSKCFAAIDYIRLLIQTR